VAAHFDGWVTLRVYSRQSNLEGFKACALRG
jgi:hypothetical protein